MPVESDFYSTKARAVMVAEGDTIDVGTIAPCVCAGRSHDDFGGTGDTTLQTIYSNVLPIWTICNSLGAKTLVGR